MALNKAEKESLARIINDAREYRLRIMKDRYMIDALGSKLSRADGLVSTDQKDHLNSAYTHATGLYTQLGLMIDQLKDACERGP